jgi:hypothetical protein
MPTTQIRPSVTIETAMILEILAKKNKKPLGVILEELLKENEYFKEVKEKIYEV